VFILKTQLSDFSFNIGVRRVLLLFYQKSGSFQGQKCNNASLTPSEIRQSRKLSLLFLSFSNLIIRFTPWDVFLSFGKYSLIFATLALGNATVLQTFF
jgi:hypothetical protein